MYDVESVNNEECDNENDSVYSECIQESVMNVDTCERTNEDLLKNFAEETHPDLANFTIDVQ